MELVGGCKSLVYFRHWVQIPPPVTKKCDCPGTSFRFLQSPWEIHTTQQKWMDEKEQQSTNSNDDDDDDDVVLLLRWQNLIRAIREM